MDMEDLLRSLIREVLVENVQQAQKHYLNTGKIDQSDFKNVLSVTRGDAYTLFLCGVEVYQTLSMISPPMDIDDLYSELRAYKKDVLPIKGWEGIMQPLTDPQTFVMVQALVLRSRILEQFQLLPSIAMRNMREELRLPRNAGDMSDYLHTISLLAYGWSQLANRPQEQLDKIAKKIFSSKYPWASDKLDAVEGAADMKLPMKGMDEVYETIERCGHGAEIVQDDERVIVVRVLEHEAIKALGCNSSWCFSMPISSGDWESYSTDNMIYWVANKLRLAEQYVVIGPYKVFDIHNQPADTGDLLRLGVNLEHLGFGAYA